MRLHRLLGLLLITSLSASLLGGCGSVKSMPPDITLRIAARDGSHCDVINAVREEFETEYKCSVEVVPMSAEELHSSAINGQSKSVADYDVIMIDDPLMPEYIENDILCNLTQMGYNDDDDFVEKSSMLGKSPYPLGATYALPFSGNVQLIFYNKDAVGSEESLTDWKSILQTCQARAANGKGGYAIRGQSGNPIVSDFLPILWAFGGDLFDENGRVILNSNESREALEFYCKLYSTGGNYEKDDLVSAITSGEAAVALGWPSWFITADGQSAEISQIPGKKNKYSNTYQTGEIGNWLVGVTSNSAHKEEALELVKFLTSERVQREALSYGGVPTRVSIFRDKKILEQYPYFKQIYSGTNNSRVRPRTSKWYKIEEAFGAQLVKCINGDQTVEKTLDISQKVISQAVAP